VSSDSVLQDVVLSLALLSHLCHPLVYREAVPRQEPCEGLFHSCYMEREMDRVANSKDGLIFYMENVV